MSNISNRFERIIKALIFLEVFLIPLFFLNTTLEYFETQKLFLLSTINLVTLILIIIKFALNNEFKLIKTNFEVLFSFVLISTILSTLFSFNFVLSSLGYFGRGFDTFIYFLSLILTVYLILNVLENEVDIEKLAKTFVFSSLLVAILFILKYFSFLGYLKGFFQIFNENNFSAIISADQLSFFLPVSIFIALSFLVNTLSESLSTSIKFVNSTFWGLSILLFSFVSAMSANNVSSFIVLGLSVLVFLALLYKGNNKRSFAIIFAIIALFGILFAGFRIFLPIKDSQNILPFNYSIEILIKSLANIKNFFLGTGPETFYFNFIKYINPSYYHSPLFLTQFSKASTEFISILVTRGVIGAISYYSLVIASIIYGIKLLKYVSDNYARNLVVAFITSLIFLFLSSFVNVSSIIIDFSIFLLIAFVAFELNINKYEGKNLLNIKVTVENYWDKKSILFKNFSYALTICILSFILLLDVLNYKAAFDYNSSNTTNNASSAYQSALSAYELEPFVDYHQTRFAIAGLNLAKSIALAAKNEKDQNKVNSMISTATDLVKQSVYKAEAAEAQNSMNPYDINAKINILIAVYSNFLNNQNYLNEATNDAEFLNNQYPNNIIFKNELAQLYVINKDYTKAVNIYKSIYSVNPNDILLDFNYAKALESNNQYSDAKKVLVYAITLTNGTGSDYTTLKSEIDNINTNLKNSK